MFWFLYKEIFILISRILGFSGLNGDFVYYDKGVWIAVVLSKSEVVPKLCFARVFSSQDVLVMQLRSYWKYLEEWNSAFKAYTHLRLKISHFLKTVWLKTIHQGKSTLTF